MMQAFSVFAANRYKTVRNTPQYGITGKRYRFIITVTAVPGHGHSIGRTHQRFFVKRVGPKRKVLYYSEYLINGKGDPGKHITRIPAYHFPHKGAGGCS
jgi:hypothetical protein